MINTLFELEKDIIYLICSGVELHTMHIDYYYPYVNRIWFQHGEFRIYLHKILPCKDKSQCLYHPHPWESVIRIIKGGYEMGVGYSETIESPKTACKLILSKDSIYEMSEPNGWHYVAPLKTPSYSIMVTGKRNGREMPVEPNKEFRKLTYEEQQDIHYEVAEYYKHKIKHN